MNDPTPPFLVDCHTHLDQYDPGELEGILERARDAGVGLVVAAGVTVDSSARCVELAHRYPQVMAGVGVHPMELRAPLDAAACAALETLAADPRVAVVSEVGLDHLPGMPDRAWQEEAFRLQIRLARRVGKPIVFHNREAGQEPLRILREEGVEAVGAIAHYFQGPREYAWACLDQGIYLSLAKPLLRLPELQELVRALPLDRIVLETDAYPQPFKRNRRSWTEPKDTALVAQRLAELKGLSLETVVRATFETAMTLLGRPRRETRPGVPVPLAPNL